MMGGKPGWRNDHNKRLLLCIITDVDKGSVSLFSLSGIQPQTISIYNDYIDSLPRHAM